MITYVDLCEMVRDIGSSGKKMGFTVGEGYVIDVLDDGATFRVGHPEKKGEPRRIPITNVASWGDDEDRPAVRAKSPEADSEEDGVEIRRVDAEGTKVFFGRPPVVEKAKAAPKAKRAKPAKAPEVEGE